MREGRLILRIVVLTLLAYALCGLYAAGRELERTENTVQQLEQELTALESANGELRRLQREALTDEGLRQLAEERLSMVMPDEIVFIFR
jgi:cell division protein FtsB